LGVGRGKKLAEDDTLQSKREATEQRSSSSSAGIGNRFAGMGIRKIRIRIGMRISTIRTNTLREPLSGAAWRRLLTVSKWLGKAFPFLGEKNN